MEKVRHRGHVRYDSTYMRYVEYTNHRDRKNGDFWGLGEGGGELVFNGDKVSCLQEEKSCGDGEG